jgi:hypothetical protein
MYYPTVGTLAFSVWLSLRKGRVGLQFDKVFGSAEGHVEKLKTTADSQQRISHGRGSEGGNRRPNQDIPFIIGQFQCYMSVSQGVALASPPQGMTCRRKKGHRQQLGGVQGKDSVIGAGID